MKSLDFIANDLSKSNTHRAIRVDLTLLFFLLLVPSSLGIFLREGLDGVFELETLLPNLLMLLVLCVFPVCHFLNTSKSTIRLLSVLAASVFMGVAVSLNRVLFAKTVTSYATSTIFWLEAEKCLVKGALSGSLVSLIISFVIYHYSPLPTRIWRWVIAAFSALSGMAMLSFHCDSSSFAHIVGAHWLQGAWVIGLSLVSQKILFVLKIKKVLGSSAKSIRNIDKII